MSPHASSLRYSLLFLIMQIYLAELGQAVLIIGMLLTPLHIHSNSICPRIVSLKGECCEMFFSSFKPVEGKNKDYNFLGLWSKINRDR